MTKETIDRELKNSRRMRIWNRDIFAWLNLIIAVLYVLILFIFTNIFSIIILSIVIGFLIGSWFWQSSINNFMDLSTMSINLSKRILQDLHDTNENFDKLYKLKLGKKRK
jgi:membrane protein implicated in regulation of membrane protease activity